ncbi:MAG TPA: GH25 family lysozyme [Mycobacteriales bacterium]|nr:GH25 family lysozyme [Mycobacteriales bacterium]
MTQDTRRRWAGVRLHLAVLAPLVVLVAQLVPQADAAVPLSGRSTAPAAAAAAPPRQVVGPDVSKYQHPGGRPIDWNAVKRSGQSFAFIKATGGSNRVDPWFAREWAAARRAGLIRGAYHYADPSRSAAAQAALIVSVVGTTREANDLGIVLDLESSGGLSPSALVHWTRAFLHTVEAKTGRVPIIYTAPNFWRDHLHNYRGFSAYPLWLARYSNTRPAPLPGWNRWTFWQHSQSHRLRGIPGDVDHNIMCCSLATLHALADGRSVRITKLWKSMGGASGKLGLPLGMEVPVPGGWGQTFEHGYVVSSRHGTFAVTGDTLARYRASGGARGPLGVPAGAARTIAAGVVEQRFAGGLILSSKGTGAHTLRGAFLARWVRDGRATSEEGLPTGEAGALSQQFAGGGLYLSGKAVHLVPGAIRDRYEELGGPTGALGLPVAEARPVLGGRAVDFQVGALYEIDVAGQKVVL